MRFTSHACEDHPAQGVKWRGAVIQVNVQVIFQIMAR